MVVLKCVLLCFAVSSAGAKFNLFDTKYKLNIEQFLVKDYDRTKMTIRQFVYRKFNRTAATLSANMTFFQDVPSFDVVVNLANALLPNKIPIKSCNIFSELFNLQQISNYGNLKFCDMKKVWHSNLVYYIQNYPPNIIIPTKLPAAENKCDVEFSYKNEWYMTVWVIATVIPIN